jgi:hypothetical protein
LDTRSKIISFEEARKLLGEHPEWVPVRMSFDAMHAPALPALAAISAPLVAVIAHKPDAYLSLRARAEMAASLRQVQAVVMEDTTLPILISLTGLVDLMEVESQWIAGLERTVIEKQKMLEAQEDTSKDGKGTAQG